MVAYLECDAAAQPDPGSIATMLHETIHRLSSATCNYEFSQDRRICIERAKGLPEGSLGGYAAAPPALDADAARWFHHVQTTYLVDNGQALWDLLDEVTGYRVEAELAATGVIRHSYLNLPLLMAFAARYLDELGRVDPAAAAAEIGPRGRIRAAVLELLDHGERSYLTWARARPPTGFERTFFADYQRARAAWLARP